MCELYHMEAKKCKVVQFGYTTTTFTDSNTAQGV